MFTKKIISFSIILFLLLTLLPQGLSINQNPSQTWYVDISNNSGPWEGTEQHPFSKIQTAIDTAESGDTIMVLSGIYKESITIDKDLILQSKDAHHPIIDGKYNQTIIHILQPNVIVNGFILRNSSGAPQSSGIQCDAENIQITHCQFYRTRSGIIVNQTEEIVISDCLFHTNGGGVLLQKANQIRLEHNDFLHNGIGINSESSSQITIQDCYTTINGIGIFLKTTTDSLILDSAIYNNNDNQGGVFLDDCQNVTIKNSRIQHNGFGVKPIYSKNIIINQSTFKHNTHVGLFNIESDDIHVTDSLFTDNFRFSVHSISGSFSIHQSNIYSSLVGIFSEDSTGTIDQNWWGSSFGPVFFEHPTIDRVRFKSSHVQIRPVSTERFEAGATWNMDSSRCQMPDDIWLHPLVNCTGQDTDNDGATDAWEKQYDYDPLSWDNHKELDPDNDGLTNIQECYTSQWGSDPFRKDIFLEVDWMPSQTGDPDQNRLTAEDIQTMKEVFEVKDIMFHIDHGKMGGGELVPYQSNFSNANLRDIYWDYFLHQDLNNPRKGIFHYCIINDWGPGPGFAFIGWDGLDSFDISAQELSENQPRRERNRLIVGGSIHELGHTLGLTVDDHQGNDNIPATWLFTKQWWRYRQYKSCMNYYYTYRILGFSDGTHGPYDFDDWSHMDYSFFKNTHFTLPDEYQ
ncbi:MAG: right-handed parallel beta-helix repeat-containing protein [Candidatus Thermoplasmatota archaeon]|nr:right-handed parallel beta-helix repeat-containing protein [Candidatus Thermoplasmatota archaeon]